MIPLMRNALPFLVFLVVLGSARVFGSLFPDNLANLQPLGALFFCGTALFGWRGLILPLAAWMITYPVTSAIQGQSIEVEWLSPLLGFAAMAGLAVWFREASSGKVFFGSLFSAVAFYFITNCLSWAFDPLYAPKNPATLLQALWTGIPGYPPTWMFFRNAMLGQGLFTLVFLIANRGLVTLPGYRSVQDLDART